VNPRTRTANAWPTHKGKARRRHAKRLITGRPKRGGGLGKRL